MKTIKEEYDDHRCWGMVSSIDLYNCNKNAIKNPKTIKKFIIDLCKEIEMKRHGSPHIERFAEGALEGYSAVQFIETSSITLHFDEGKNRSFIDIFSCKYFDYKKAEKFCKTFFDASSSKAIYYFRY